MGINAEYEIFSYGMHAQLNHHLSWLNLQVNGLGVNARVPQHLDLTHMHQCRKWNVLTFWHNFLMQLNHHLIYRKTCHGSYWDYICHWHCCVQWV